MLKSSKLPCGCRTCGCICPEHSPDRRGILCDTHKSVAIARWIAMDAATLVSLALFAVTVGVWAYLLG